ncbi:MAG: SPOR domain-containing protein [Altererythrobacter sp.]|nr:SPOR domain-containing protein [Altererythrobacter sp.]
MKLRAKRRWWTGAAIVALVASGHSAYSQEVVQPLPSPNSAQLSSALQRLAQDGNDVSALIDAGDASLGLGDVAAAIGFFGRAQAISPTNPRISLGMARAYTLSRRPVEALRLFAEAEKGGIPLAAMAAERGLAFDLVGDAASAQELYRLALASGPDEDVRRKLALSQAISGDKAGFEATLLPLLEKGDFAAFRTRAFGLAILGDTEDAVKIARDMMPGAASAQIEPYLRYMTQLTPAQQAAAGALGVFPRSTNVGRDDADIAAYSRSGSSSAKTADSSLAPVGAPLGGRSGAKSDRDSSSPRSNRKEKRRAERGAGNRRTSRSPSAAVSDMPTSAAQNTPSAELPAVASSRELPQNGPELSAAKTDDSDARNQIATNVVTTPPQPAAELPTPVASSSEPRASVSEAFAGLDLAESSSTAPRVGAVDIRAIEVPRETNEPPKPTSPSRHWVQIATGRDISALAFDWRRIVRNASGELAGKNAFTATWGEANRLLAGPYGSAKEARAVVGKLKAIGVDSFTFTSARGEEVTALAGTEPAPVGPPPAPANPARHWVQVATGRDRDALAFDWRRISRKAEGALKGKGPYVAGWGATNRLLSGPYDSEAAAQEMVTALNQIGIDSFTFSSKDGETVEKLD